MQLRTFDELALQEFSTVEEVGNSTSRARRLEETDYGGRVLCEDFRDVTCDWTMFGF